MAVYYELDSDYIGHYRLRAHQFDTCGLCICEIQLPRQKNIVCAYPHAIDGARIFAADSSIYFVQKSRIAQHALGSNFWTDGWGFRSGNDADEDFFEGISSSLLEAAELEGAGDLRIFWQMVLPLSQPIIATVAIMNALTGWNNYIWPLVVTSGDRARPIILALSNIKGPLDQVQGMQFAGYVIASVPMLILFVFATRSFISGITSGAMKG